MEIAATQGVIPTRSAWLLQYGQGGARAGVDPGPTGSDGNDGESDRATLPGPFRNRLIRSCTRHPNWAAYTLKPLTNRLSCLLRMDRCDPTSLTEPLTYNELGRAALGDGAGLPLRPGLLIAPPLTKGSPERQGRRWLGRHQ
jgi:hypothetical protein